MKRNWNAFLQKKIGMQIKTMKRVILEMIMTKSRKLIKRNCDINFFRRI